MVENAEIPTGGEAGAPIKVTGLIRSLYGLWWFFGAAIGAPSLVQVVRSTLVSFDPGYFLGAILQGYNDFCVVLSWVTSPLKAFIVRWFADLPFLTPSVRGEWIHVFAVLLVWSAAACRVVYLRTGIRQAHGLFVALFLGSGTTSILFGMVERGPGFFSELLVPGIPIAVISFTIAVAYFFRAAANLFADRSVLKEILVLIWAPFGSVLVCVIPIIGLYYGFGLRDGRAGLLGFLLLTFIVAAGAAHDSSKAGDKLSAEFFAMVLGPYVGMAALILVCVVESSIRSMTVV